MPTIKLTGFNTSTGRSTTAGDGDTVDVDGSLTIGNADTDAVIFNAEIDSDFIPDDSNTYDLGSSSKRWAEAHIENIYAYNDLDVQGDLSFSDTMMVELSISGVQLQTDTNAYRFNCPFGLEITGLILNLDQHGTSGNVTVTVASGATTMITLSITGTNLSANTQTVSSGTRSSGDVVTFAITATPTTNTNGLRASLFFRRSL